MTEMASCTPSSWPGQLQLASSAEQPAGGKVSAQISHIGHISRLPDTRLPKRILFSRIEQKGGRGRPMKCWTDYVREDLDALLDALRILPSWARLAQDGEAWRTKSHDLLGHTQP